MAFVYVKHVINTPQTSLFTCRNCVFIRELAECSEQRGTRALNAHRAFSVFSVYLQPKPPDTTTLRAETLRVCWSNGETRLPVSPCADISLPV